MNRLIAIVLLSFCFFPVKSHALPQIKCDTHQVDWSAIFQQLEAIKPLGQTSASDIDKKATWMLALHNQCLQNAGQSLTSGIDSTKTFTQAFNPLYLIAWHSGDKKAVSTLGKLVMYGEQNKLINTQQIENYYNTLVTVREFAKAQRLAKRYPDMPTLPAD